jgi:F0F1-type ATP synthase membrane subunit b/b'
MQLLDYTTLIPVLGALATLGGLIATGQRIVRNARKEREHQFQNYLKSAKEEDAVLEAKFEAKISKVEWELENLKQITNNEFEHVRETYNSEIKNLGEKIESLRDQLNTQHSQLIEFLSRLIDKK